MLTALEALILSILICILLNLVYINFKIGDVSVDIDMMWELIAEEYEERHKKKNNKKPRNNS